MASPNFLILMTDQHRWDAMGCAGHPLVRTPHLDRLAREGVHFRQAVTSCPLCVPARASLATGLMPRRLGIVNNEPPARRPAATLMSLLGDAGYRTHAIGRMHFMPEGEETYGFQTLELAEDTWLATAGTARPDLPRVRTFEQWDLVSERGCRQSAAHYLANVTLIDAQIGRIVAALEARGILDDTVIVYLADHGELLGDHGLWFKKFGYEGSWRIPFIVRGGRHFRGGRPSDALASILDVMPTLLAQAGVAAPPGLAGVDLGAVLAGSAPGRDCQVGECEHYGGQMTFLRTPRWKYIHHEKGGIEELYDLAADPEELRNLRDGHDGVRADARGRIQRWLAAHSDPAASLDAAGRLRAKPYVPMPDRNDRPLPFALPPWQLRAPPALLHDVPDGWWWTRRQAADWSVTMPPAGAAHRERLEGDPH